MKEALIPVFVIGSGRSGTRTIFKLLSGITDIEIYHEYLCTHIQKISALYYMNFISKQVVKDQLMLLHGAAIYYSEAKYWIDCSNKLSWIIEPLIELFPNAKFIYIVRDGRKVVSSYYHKLPDEMYDDKSTEILKEWINSNGEQIMPPPEKKYWWNIPTKGNPYCTEFQNYSRFQRVCFQWAESNRIIMDCMKHVPSNQQYFCKLEDLVSNKNILKDLLMFVGVDYDERFFEFLQIPQNVIVPIDFNLTEKQATEFNIICKEIMNRLGYSEQSNYRMKY